MEQEYRLSIFSKILYGFLAVASAGLNFFFVIKGLADNNTIGGIILSIVLFTISALLSLYIIKRKVIVSNDEVSINGVYGFRRLYINNIKGFRNNGKALIIYPVNDQDRKLKITDYNAISKSEELIQWLKSNVRDLDNEDYEEEKAVILQDSDLGFTQEEREAKLKKVSVLALVYSGIVFVLMLISIFFPKSNFVLSMTVFVFPLIGIALMALSRGLIRLNIKKKSAYPSIFLGLFFACIALIIRAFIDTKILDFSKVWTPVIVCAIILIGILSLIILKQANPTTKGQIVPVVLISTVFSVGAVQQINREFDGSKPQVFSASVTDQYIKRGKSTTYHIVITGWQYHQTPDDITVSSNFYDQATVGSKVNVNLKEGKLHIPWYYITL